ncbi:MAG: DUF4157 domain-containing protein [Myxococcaceae bacterium]
MADHELVPPPRHVPEEQQANEVAVEVALGGKRPGEQEFAQAATAFSAGRDGAGSAESIRAAVGARMGADLGNIRLVPNSGEARSSGSIAFAQHDEVHFAPGAYRPDHPLGRALVAHELTHSAQLSQRSMSQHGGAHSAHSGGGARGGRDARLNFEFCDLFGPSTSSSSSSTSTATPSSTSTSTTTAGSGTPTTTSATPTGGSGVRTNVDSLVDVYNKYDLIRVGLAEIKKGTSLSFHKSKGRKRVEDFSTTVLKSKTAITEGRLKVYDKLIGAAETKKWDKTADTGMAMLLADLAPPVISQLNTAGLTSKSQQNTNINWLQNVPGSVFQLLLDCSNAKIPPALLFAVAMNEGLADTYIRPQTGATNDQLSATELASVSVTQPVDGFYSLGLDQYWDESTETNHPLSGYLPSGFDTTKVGKAPHANEKGKMHDAAKTPDLKMALQIQVAILSRRIDLFLDQAAKLGYPTPTDEERLYLGYVFYNSGPGEGHKTLSKHQPGGSDPRKLGDWISMDEYHNATKVLNTYRFVVAAGLLKGF